MRFLLSIALATLALTASGASPIGVRLLVNPTPFSPTNFSNLKLWLDAPRIAGLSDGTGVSRWSDYSGQGNDATQSTAGLRPTFETGEQFGKPSVRGDGSSDWLGIPSVLGTNGQTVFFVFKNSVDVPSNRIFVYVSTAGLEIGVFNYSGWKHLSFIYGGVGTSSGFDDSSLLASNTAIAMVVMYSGGAVSTPGNYRAWVNGAEKTVIASGAFSAGSKSSLLARSTGAHFAQGAILECGSYQSTLTTNEIGQLFGYLNAKWRIY